MQELLWLIVRIWVLYYQHLIGLGLYKTQFQHKTKGLPAPKTIKILNYVTAIKKGRYMKCCHDSEISYLFSESRGMMRQMVTEDVDLNRKELQLGDRFRFFIIELALKSWKGCNRWREQYRKENKQKSPVRHRELQSYNSQLSHCGFSKELSLNFSEDLLAKSLSMSIRRETYLKG